MSNKFIIWNNEIMEALNDGIDRMKRGEYHDDLVMVYDERTDGIYLMKRQQRFYNIPYETAPYCEEAKYHGYTLIMNEESLRKNVEFLSEVNDAYTLVSNAQTLAINSVQCIMERVKTLNYSRDMVYTIRDIVSGDEIPVYPLTERMHGDEVEGWECNAVADDGSIYRLHFDADFNFEDEHIPTSSQF